MRQDHPGATRRALRRDRVTLLLATAFTLTVFLLSWWRHATFRSSTLDLAVFDQAVWKLAHLQSPEVTTIGWNAFADHLSPVLFFFAPLYRLAATPLWFFAAQALALGAGYLALASTLEAAGLPSRLRPAFSVAYLASPLLWNAALYDFHPTTLAVPFLLLALRAALLNQHRSLLAYSAVLVFLRDDLGLAVTALALVGITSDRDGRRLRFLLAAGGLAWMALGGALASLLGSDRHWDFHYGYLADTPTAALLHPLRSAARLAVGIARADNLGLVVLGYLAPLAFLPLLRPARLAMVGVLALPLLASAGEQFHSPLFHYGAYMFPFLLVVAAGAASRIPNRWSAWGNPALLTGLAVVLLLAAGPIRNLTRPAPNSADARAALALILPTDRVVATDQLGAHLAERDQLRIFPYPFAAPVPDFPLTTKARESSAEAVRQIDAVVLNEPFFEEEAAPYEAFLASPFLQEFHVAGRFGSVVVYRRTLDELVAPPTQAP